MPRPSALPPDRPSPPPASARGSSLIELMIAMAVLAVGLLAMWHLHVLGLTSTAAGRRHTIATAVARELLSGLERLSYTDERISKNYFGPGTSVPSGELFGALVDGDGLRSDAGGAHAWEDTDARRIPGVRKNGEMPEQAEGAGYERRWTVWEVQAPSGGTALPGAKLVAVSVIWRDPPFARPREVVLYGVVPNPSAVAAGLVGVQ